MAELPPRKAIHLGGPGRLDPPAGLRVLEERGKRGLHRAADVPDFVDLAGRDQLGSLLVMSCSPDDGEIVVDSNAFLRSARIEILTRQSAWMNMCL